MKIITTFWVCATLAIASNAVADNQPLEAGDGDYAFFIKPSDSNSTKVEFKRYQSYARVTVEAWFINKQGSFWHDRMASGTCEAKIGEEDYNIALGTFTLANGAFDAPSIGSVAVDNRLWVGGDLQLKLFLKANQNDTALASVLKDMAQSSLGVASGSAATYGAQLSSGPYAPLVKAGQTLVTSVQNILSSGPKPLPIFDLDSGFNFTKQLTELHGEVNYILFFRGTPNLVTDNNLRVTETNGKTDVLVNGQKLRDGAWMLVKVENKRTYDKPRPWEEEAYTLQNDITNKLWLFNNGLLSKKDMEAQFAVTSPAISGTAFSATQTLGDRLVALNAVILNDTTISYDERNAQISKNQTTFALALASYKAKSISVYTNGITAFSTAIISGDAPTNKLVRVTYLKSFTNIQQLLQGYSKPEAVVWADSSTIFKERALQGKKDSVLN